MTTMTEGFSPTLTTTAKAAASKPRRTKRARKATGKLTKARRAELLKQGIAVEVFFGVPVRLRLADDFLSSTDLLAAASAKLGRKLRLFDFFRQKDAQAFLAARSKKTGIRVFSDDPGEGPFLVERAGKGGLGWVERAVGLRLAAWGDAELEEAIYAFVLAAHDKARKRPLAPKLPPAQTEARRLANRDFAEVLRELELPFALFNRMKVHYLTDHPPEWWDARLGPGWKDRCSAEHQNLQHDAARAAAAALQQVELPPLGEKGRKGTAFEAMKAAVRVVRDYARTLGKPWQPDAGLLLEVALPT